MNKRNTYCVNTTFESKKAKTAATDHATLHYVRFHQLHSINRRFSSISFKKLSLKKMNDKLFQQHFNSTYLGKHTNFSVNILTLRIDYNFQ